MTDINIHDGNMSDTPDKFVYEVWVEFLETKEKRPCSKVFQTKAPATACKNRFEKYKGKLLVKYFVVESILSHTQYFY